MLSHRRSDRFAIRCVAGAAAAVLIAAALPASLTAAAPSQNACDKRTNNTYSKLIECVRLEGVRAHQAALQDIANANGGNRAAGTTGYTDSVDYVVDTLEAAGWTVTLDEFPFTFTPTPTLQQLTPVAASYETGTFTGTGFGTVTGNVIAVDINLVPPRASTSGCEAADFAGLNFSGPSDIALIQRGTCTFATKAVNAQAAGAEAVSHAGHLLHEPWSVETGAGGFYREGDARSRPGVRGWVAQRPAEGRSE